MGPPWPDTYLCPHRLARHLAGEGRQTWGSPSSRARTPSRQGQNGPCRRAGWLLTSAEPPGHAMEMARAFSPGEGASTPAEALPDSQGSVHTGRGASSLAEGGGVLTSRRGACTYTRASSLPPADASLLSHSSPADTAPATDTPPSRGSRGAKERAARRTHPR